MPVKMFKCFIRSVYTSGVEKVCVDFADNKAYKNQLIAYLPAKRISAR